MVALWQGSDSIPLCIILCRRQKKVSGWNYNHTGQTGLVPQFHIFCPLALTDNLKGVLWLCSQYFLFNPRIQSAKQAAAIQCIQAKALQIWSRGSVVVQTKHQNANGKWSKDCWCQTWWFKISETLNQMTRSYNSILQKTIKVYPLKWIDGSRRPQQVPLMSSKNKKFRLQQTQQN